MRTKSRPSKNDIERNSGVFRAQNRPDNDDSEAARSPLNKRKRLMIGAAVFTVIVAVLVATLVLLTGSGENANAVNNAPNNAPPVTPSSSPMASPLQPPSITGDNGKNDPPSSSFPTILGNNIDDSPTLAPSLFPTLTIISALPTMKPSQLPITVTPSKIPTMTPTNSPFTPFPSQLPSSALSTTKPTSFPSPIPTITPSVSPSTPLPSQPPTMKPSTALPTLLPSSPPTVKNDNNIFDNFDEVVPMTDNFQILQRVAHDSTAFTQGLFYNKDTGMLIEGTGRYGRSLMRIWNPLTGQVIRETSTLDAAYFGEGVTWYEDANGNERLIQLTWQEQQAFIYDTNLNLLDSFNYNGRTTTNEGWGITFDTMEKIFYVSDGSRYIHIWDLNFQLVRKFAVRWKETEGSTNAVVNLNEMEWDPESRTILSNVWYKDYIVRIWPNTGKVIQVYDMSSLQSGGGNVLNGIAHHSANKWWITGKEWRFLYLIEFNE